MKSVLLIGSGPIVIGQAAEFDYAGTQAIKALKSKGYRVILLNNNPATIMTDLSLVDTLYSEPMTTETALNIIKAEKPQAIVLGMGGQTGLNIGMALYHQGVFDHYGVEVLGTHPADIERAEDRQLFKQCMEAIGQPVIESLTAKTLEEALVCAHQIGYPVIVRPAFTLGGFGGGICLDEAQLKETASEGLHHSPVSQVLIEGSIDGWKEIEYEMIRDHKGQTIAVCNMENIDPVGIHTGDSIVVAPSQTLTDHEYHQLRNASKAIVSHLKIVGACNVQFAVSPDHQGYYVIEVNPRVSRSSALASKATGYPIAKIAMLIGMGYGLEDIDNPLTGQTKACHEPTLDYCVVKLPRLPFDKLDSSNLSLGTTMRATGECMTMAATFEEAFLKAMRSIEMHQGQDWLDVLEGVDQDQLINMCHTKHYQRIWAVMALMTQDLSLERLGDLTGMDAFFLRSLHEISTFQKTLKNTFKENLSHHDLLKAKRLGFSDGQIALYLGVDSHEIRYLRDVYGIKPKFRMVDTCGGEFDARSNYFYSTYYGTNESQTSSKRKIIVLGSGPIRIGQGVEFDYCSVKALQTIQMLGYEAIMINNNPETVSTDYDASDKLYFEPLDPESVLAVIDHEEPFGVLVQYGGQTGIGLTHFLQEQGVRLIGLDAQCVDQVEDRDAFNALMDDLGLQRTKGGGVRSLDQARVLADHLGYPLIMRPSYVIGGHNMAIIRNEKALTTYMGAQQKRADEVILVDQFVQGTEYEIDVLTDGQAVFIPGIMEHLEPAGVHSGDSTALYPAKLSKKQSLKLIEMTERICRTLGLRGVLNLQFIKKGHHLVVIEVNPRASRSLPFIAKVTATPLVEWSVKLALGMRFKEVGLPEGLLENKPYHAIKVPVFSSLKLPGVDCLLGPNMQSTGEAMYIDTSREAVLYKALVAEGHYEKKPHVLISCKKEELTPLKLSESSVTWDWMSSESETVIDDIHHYDFKVYTALATLSDINEGTSQVGTLIRQKAAMLGVIGISSQAKLNILLHAKQKDQKPSLFALRA